MCLIIKVSDAAW